jgi:D-threo-aldose 1-dehydrogenase
LKVKKVRGRVALTEFGIGCAQYGNLSKPVSDEDTLLATQSAWDQGVRYFDAAPHYGLGLAEERLGKAIAGLPRDELVISTKVGRLLIPTPERAHLMDDGGFAVPAAYRREFDFSRDGVLRSFEASLKRLHVDFIDILYLHDPDGHWDSASTTGVETLIELRDQGVVKAVGAGMNQSEMLTRFVKETDIDLVMLAGRFTLLEQGALDELLPAAIEKNVGIVNVGVYNSGLLSRNRPNSTLHYDYAPASEVLIHRVNQIADICEKYGVTLPEAAIQYGQFHPAVVSTVIGVRSEEQVLENLRRFRKEIPHELWEELSAQGLCADLSSLDQTRRDNA